MVQADSEPGHSSEKSPYQFGTWYPIESAPKDGSSILLIQSIDYGFRLRHGLYFSAHWNDDDEAWESCETGVTSSRRRPFRIIPDAGQVSEYGAHSVIEQRCHVFHEHEPRAQLANEPGVCGGEKDSKAR